MALVVELHKQLRANDLLASSTREKLLLGQLEAIQPLWYEHPVVIVVLTVAATSAVYWGAVQAVKASK